MSRFYCTYLGNPLLPHPPLFSSCSKSPSALESEHQKLSLVQYCRTVRFSVNHLDNHWICSKPHKEILKLFVLQREKVPPQFVIANKTDKGGLCSQDPVNTFAWAVNFLLFILDLPKSFAFPRFVARNLNSPNYKCKNRKQAKKKRNLYHPRANKNAFSVF